MGIPSYFRRIMQKYPGCLQKGTPSTAKALCFDFNCLIYRCLRAPGLSEYPADGSFEEKEAWEQSLLQEVCKVVEEVWRVSGRPPQVLLAVDGVVPMAKIRQQRVRRFKSAWLRGQSEKRGWDSNAITPGTAFMEKLGIALQALVTKHGRGWEVSGVDQPGEGEHKILHWLRQGHLKSLGDVIIYGLDADLILLTMLVGEELQIPIWLLREIQEFGGQQSQSNNSVEQEYQFMNINEFKLRLGLQGKEIILHYIAVMTLMGNDFLPHSITHKLSDDGHDYVLEEVRKRDNFVSPDGKIDPQKLKDTFKRWSLDEEEKLLSMIQKKREQAKRGVLKGMDEREALPLTWDVEQILLDSSGFLHQQWKETYWSWIQKKGITSEQKSFYCQEYLKGCQWVLDYYQGKEVDLFWMFPAWIPPLWSDLAKYDYQVTTNINAQQITPLLPQEQLALVLPLESWNLIRDKELLKLPIVLPQLWPRQFPFFSAGRKWLWECEALIPPFLPNTLRQFLA